MTSLHRPLVVSAAIVVILVASHLGAGAVLADRWREWLWLIAAAVTVKLMVVALGWRHAKRGRRTY